MLQQPHSSHRGRAGHWLGSNHDHHMPDDTPEYARVSKSMQRYCNIMQGYARVSKSMQEYCKIMQGYVRVSKSMQEYCKISMHGCVTVQELGRNNARAGNVAIMVCKGM